MKKILLSLIILFSAFILAISIRGNIGTPTGTELLSPYWMQAGPFELSPERGRYALLYSIVEDGSFIFDLPIARFATPDVAILNGNYVSLFAPLVSFIAIPGYIVGKFFGAAQVGAFAVISLFAIFNLLLTRAIAIKLGAKELPATITSMIFVFASPAFAYGVTLYQHHISTFLILAACFILLKWKNWLSLSLIWLLFATSIPVDYPNFILMLPVALYATGRMIWISKFDSGIKLNINFLKILTPIAMILPLIFYIWFSNASYGKPLQLSGTLDGVQEIGQDGKPVSSTVRLDSSITRREFEADQKKTATGFFKTRNILNGLYIHLLSPDRGIFYFTPVMLFGILGAFFLWAKKQNELALISGIIGANVLLYSMWGDPWGGWAFGSRYLIPTYALLSVLTAIAITRLAKNIVFILAFSVIAIYSISVNTLGALTINANPPQVEVLGLEKQTGQEEKYTFERNWDYLLQNGSKSFAYNTYFKDFLKPVEYYVIISSLITLVLGGLMTWYVFNKSK